MDEQPLLELIPREELTRRQKELLPLQMGYVNVPIYQLSREPTRLEEFDWDSYEKLNIWRDNQTVICLSKDTLETYLQGCLSFVLFHDDKYKFKCAIYGITDEAIAETATFFFSLKHSGAGSLEIRYSCLLNVPLTCLQNDQLARIFDANPQRMWEIQNGVWSPEQSVVLASRPGTLNVRLASSPMPMGGFEFQDDGTAFVNALQQRQSSFGSLGITSNQHDLPLSDENLQRLFQFEHVFEKLTFVRLQDNESVLLPFTAKVNALEYLLEARTVQSPDQFHSLAMNAKELNVTIILDAVDHWDGLFISFLNRVAELGHFVKLDVSLHYLDESYLEDLQLDRNAPSRIVQTLIRVIKGNPNLTHLDVYGMHWFLEWCPHIQNIFEALKDHLNIRTLVVKPAPLDTDSDDSDDGGDSDTSETSDHPVYSWLEQLLSRNRNITVLDCFGDKISNGSRIDRLYSLNRFYHGSAKLVKESSSVCRRQLVTAALVASAATDSQRTALLLADHTDVLCEVVDDVNRDEDATGVAELAMEETVLPAADETLDRSKRKAETPPSHSVKKASM